MVKYAELYWCSYLWTYDLLRPVHMVLMGPNLLLAIGGDGPWKSRLSWALCIGIEQLEPNPLPLAQVMDLPATKAVSTGPYESEVHR